jgi:23S rRNA pseudouridine2605 synthase
MSFNKNRNSRDDKSGRDNKKSFRSDSSDRSKPANKFSENNKAPFDKRSEGDKDRKDAGSRNNYSGSNTDRKPYGQKRDDAGSERKSFGNRRDDTGRERKPYGEKREGFSGERKPYGDRKNTSGGERKPYGQRNEGFGGERKSFPKRDDSNTERRPYGEKREGFSDDRKPYGDRNNASGGERKPYGQRKEGFGGERKSFPKREEGNSERKPFGQRNEGFGGERKPFTKRDDSNSERKPFGQKREGFNSDRKPFAERKERISENLTPDEQLEREYKTPDPQNHSRPYTKTLEPRKEFAEAVEDDQVRLRSRKPKSTPAFKKDSETIRLNRYIANAGICSRRKADELIASGVVTVNGEVVSELGAKVNPATDQIRYNGEILKREKMVYVLLNKPRDFITTTEDPQERKTVMELVDKASKERIYPVGRLDRNTTGLLLMTNDGDLAEKLSHPRNNITKIYNVELSRNLTQGDFNKIAFGLELEDGFIKPDSVSYVTGAGKNEIGIQIHSGKNRIVRRIFESLGYEVVKLDRVIYANLTKKDLPRGKWRYLAEQEIIRLKHFIK